MMPDRASRSPGAAAGAAFKVEVNRNPQRSRKTAMLRNSMDFVRMSKSFFEH